MTAPIKPPINVPIIPPMNPNDPNVVMLELVARHLGDRLRRELVFVGGAVAGLLITDPALPAIRPTEDVDLIVETLTRADYHRIERALMAQGFKQDIRQQAPICRWRIDSMTVDIMPTLEDILGFSNRWYPLALATAQALSLPSGLAIRIIQAPVFLGTKLEAFESRGARDYLFSHDLGDVISVVDGREGLVAECQEAPADLRKYLAHWAGSLLSTPAFVDALPGHLPGDPASQERLPDLLDRLGQLAKLEPAAAA